MDTIFSTGVDDPLLERDYFFSGLWMVLDRPGTGFSLLSADQKDRGCRIPGTVDRSIDYQCGV